MKVSAALQHLPNQALLDETARLARMEQVATAELIMALAEVDARKLFLGQGCSSMYVYCTRVLHLSEHAAYDRIEAARLGRRFPLVLERLACGALTLTNLRLLGPHLRSATVEPLLDAAAHKTKFDVERMIAGFSEGGPPDAEACTLHFEVSQETREKLRQAQELLRHAIPDGDVSKIFDKALTVLLADINRKKLGATSHPRRARLSRSHTRHVPSGVKREVWQRDQGQCAFEGPEGRCSERGFLEFHHVKPFADGGESVVENIQLRCRAHNQYEAEVFYAGAGASLVREASGPSTVATGPRTNPTGPGTSWIDWWSLAGARRANGPAQAAVTQWKRRAKRPQGGRREFIYVVPERAH